MIELGMKKSVSTGSQSDCFFEMSVVVTGGTGEGRVLCATERGLKPEPVWLIWSFLTK